MIEATWYNEAAGSIVAVRKARGPLADMTMLAIRCPHGSGSAPILSPDITWGSPAFTALVMETLAMFQAAVACPCLSRILPQIERSGV